MVEAYLLRINEHTHLNAFVQVFEEDALEAADQVDQKIASGNAGRLAGLIIGIKDVLCYQDHMLTASSKILDGFHSQFTGTTVQRLLDEDAVIIGRQNCDEFAMGSSNENSSYEPVRNPHNTDCVPGGSSGGSAAAVAARLCHVSLGSDTGGSVRQPASFCGVVGMKPTYGRFSRWGLIAYASSFDQIGLLTHSVEDASLLFQIMAGPDTLDNTASTQDIPSWSPEETPSDKLKLGYLPVIMDSEVLDPEIKARFGQWMKELKAEGHELIPLEFSYLDYLVPCYYTLTTAEASSNLARFDGVHYGYRTPESEDLYHLYTRTRSEGFGEEVKRRIMLGSFVLSAGYFDAYYAQAAKVRRLIREETLKMFGSVDLILSPVTPGPAFKLGEKTEDPIEMYLSDIFTVHANLAGLPAISLPLGQHSSNLPFGLQLMAAPFEEEKMMKASNLLMESLA